MRILKLLAPSGTLFCLFYLCITLGLFLGTSARPAYIPTSQHRYTSVSRRGVSGSNTPFRSKARPLKQYNMRAVLTKGSNMALMEHSKAEASDPDSTQSLWDSRQRRQSGPMDPSTTATGIPSASFNRKRESGSHPLDDAAAARPS